MLSEIHTLDRPRRRPPSRPFRKSSKTRRIFTPSQSPKSSRIVLSSRQISQEAELPRSFLGKKEGRKEERRKGKKLGSRGAAHKERIMQRRGAAYDALCRDATPVSSSPIANTTRNMCGGGLIGGMPWDRFLSLSLSTRLRINTITAFES